MLALEVKPEGTPGTESELEDGSGSVGSALSASTDSMGTPPLPPTGRAPAVGARSTEVAGGGNKRDKRAFFASSTYAKKLEVCRFSVGGCCGSVGALSSNEGSKSGGGAREDTSDAAAGGDGGGGGAGGGEGRGCICSSSSSPGRVLYESATRTGGVARPKMSPMKIGINQRALQSMLW